MFRVPNLPPTRAGAAAGFVATLVFPPLCARFGLRKTGAGAVLYQLAWLLVGAGPTAACALAGRRCGGPRQLITGVALSRTGLWAFDLAVSQLMQEEARAPARARICRLPPCAPKNKRKIGLWRSRARPLPQVLAEEIGTVNGVHGAICAAMEMGSFAAGLLLRRPEQFGLLLAMSLCSVRGALSLPRSCSALSTGRGHTAPQCHASRAL